MFYPLKFKPVFKGYNEGYIWGGRNFASLGKSIPDGIVAESWEVSCHPDGTSVIANGEHEGMLLPDFVKKFGRQAIGTSLPEKDLAKFPLLVKFIDANDRLSVQVHPDDGYAQAHENGEYGKNEMWYIISAKPGAELIYDVVPGTTREDFAAAVRENRIESCLKRVRVSAGDAINIPSGLVHAIGSGILLAEIQQNSNTTYRVYDYDRTDSRGNRRPLHIEKALDVIDFDTAGRREKYEGLELDINGSSKRKFLVANKYFAAEYLSINGVADEAADGSRFFIYTFVGGKGRISYGSSDMEVKGGESLLIPASMGRFRLEGNMSALKSYVPDLAENVIKPLTEAGFSKNEILSRVGGLMYNNL